MKVLSWEELRGGGLSGAAFAATIGVFDGLHIGHRELISRILGKEGLASLVLTFRESPKLKLSPATHGGVLSTLEQKLELVASAGADFCALIDFSGDFSKLPGRRFLSMLRDCGELRLLAVGSDFRCGQGLDTDARDIRSFCEGQAIGFESLEAVRWAGHPVSSSRIRKSIVEGRLGDAAAMLGRPYEIDLRGSSFLAEGRAKPAGLQASPPPGSYDAILVTASGSVALESRGAARLDGEGCWSFGAGPGAAEGGKPEKLRLMNLVSRG